MITLFSLFVMIMMGATDFDMAFFSAGALGKTRANRSSVRQIPGPEKGKYPYMFFHYIFCGDSVSTYNSVSKSNTSSSSSSDSEFIIQCSTIPWLKGRRLPLH